MIKSFTWILGIVLLVIGIVGLFSSPVFGLFQVATANNVVYLLSGAIAIIAASSGSSYARLYLIIAGIFYGLIAVIGFANNGDILSSMDVNNADNYLHSVIALISLGLGFGRKK